MAKKRTAQPDEMAPQPSDEGADMRVMFLARPAWLARLDAIAESLGLSTE